MSVIFQKLKEAALSVVPIILLVLFLNFTVSPLEIKQLIRFLIGALLIIFGLSIFLLGVELSIDKIGRHMGSTIAKSNRVWIVVVVGILLGFIISVAEPDLHILAGQVDVVSGGHVSKSSIVVIVSIGVALLLSLGLVRIIYNIALQKILIILYGVILILAIFTSPEFMPISFDASGATTGALTVPFILALALGVSQLKKDSKASETDSFGLVAIASTGAIISVMAMSIINKANKITGSLESSKLNSDSIINPFVHELPKISFEIIIALLPILVLFLIFQKTSFKLPKHEKARILIGLLYTFIGLVLLLTGVNAGFMEVGAIVGFKIAALDNKALLIAIGFIMGLLTILAEPAVFVLTNQIENVTSGYVKRKTVLAALSIGVGVSVALSMIRILIPELKLWHYLLPGYAIALVLTYFVPKLFVGIAFDSGGVASGPMTATFILAFAQGAADCIEGADVLLDGFGIISMVALTPLITLQILGLIYKAKSRKGELENEL
ncbi:MAG: DUF1538 domain-containing protein [Firmicutes bacterium HGW-Firmicutes-16]|nr:MAG: DUF1538 domain-containing protein [Firmicutes bacterium HGW-Firmicutes-16]